MGVIRCTCSRSITVSRPWTGGRNGWGDRKGLGGTRVNQSGHWSGVRYMHSRGMTV